jgi:hypothetical protein
MRQLMLAVIALLIGASSLLAQGHMGTPQEQQACTRDAQRFCRKQLGDDSAVQQCLQQNRTKLSKSCQKVFQSHGMELESGGVRWQQALRHPRLSDTPCR